MVDDRPEENGSPVVSDRPKRAPPTIDLQATEVSSEPAEQTQGEPEPEPKPQAAEAESRSEPSPQPASPPEPVSKPVSQPISPWAIAPISGRRIQRTGWSGEWVASPGELPFGEDERAALGKVGHEPGGYGLFALVDGAVGAQGAEGDGVGAALGREVAAEAKHVRPGR